MLRNVYTLTNSLLLKLYACLILKYLFTTYFNNKDVNIMKFDDKIFIAIQIKMHRKKAGYTQEELAELVDLSTQHISRIESGCYIPSLKSFFMIASVLNMDLKLFGYNINTASNPRKDELIHKIITATDAELVFYENLIEAADKSLDNIRKNIL